MRKLHAVMVAFVLILLTANLIDFFSSPKDSLNPQAVNGTLNLESIDFNQVPYVDLDGQWEFYWQQLLAPPMFGQGHIAPQFVHVPQVWTNYPTGSDGKRPNEGYATYRMQVKLGESAIGQTMAIYVFGAASAYKLWINDKMVASAGTVGTGKESMAPRIFPKVFYFVPDSRDLAIVAQVSNFSQRKAGLWEKIKLGSAEQISAVRGKNVAIQLFFVGPLLFMGFYHLVIYSRRLWDKSPLYLGLICLIISLRTLLVGEVLLVQLFPGINWEFQVKLEYLTVTTSLSMTVLYLRSQYPQECSRSFQNIHLVVGFFFCLFILATPASVFTYSIQVLEVFTVFTFLYAIYALFRASLHHRESAILNIFAAIIVFLFVLNDILYHNQVIYSKDLLSVGLFGFLIVQAFILSAKYSDSFAKAETATLQLRSLNEELDRIVKERTSSLELSKQQLIEANERLYVLSYFDALTGIHNRRSFEASLEDASKNSVDRSFTLMLLDVDFFKDYNDTYGHPAGDQCLKQVSVCLAETTEPLGGVAARLGGEEFGVLLTGQNEEQAVALANRLREKVLALQIPHLGSRISAYLTISVGVCFQEQLRGTEGSERLVREADEALYKAKRLGRNQVCVYFTK